MLVIVSDLHLTDGTTGKTITLDAFRLFAQRLLDTAFRASWRANGRYKPIHEMELVLLGDIFDHHHSVRWHDEQAGEPGYARPWLNPEGRNMVEKIGAITEAILAYNFESLAILKCLCEGEAITLPPASHRGKPVIDVKERIPVKVNIHYVVGNHDWFFHLPTSAYNPIRGKVINSLGLANAPNAFPHNPVDSPQLMETFSEHQIFARHGDIFSSFTYNERKGRNAATLGDAIVIDFIDRFPIAAREQMGDELPVAFVEGLKELANVRPNLLVPVWIDGLIDRTLTHPAQAVETKKIWNTLADEFLNLPFVRAQDNRLNPIEPFDFLSTALKLSINIPFKPLANIVTRIKQIVWGSQVSYARYAIKENTFKNRSARYIIYGHTHRHEVIPLDSTRVGGLVVDQVYINSGTWHALHDLTTNNPYKKMFIAHKVMTYLAFFKNDERSGRPFESWHGTLSWPDTVNRPQILTDGFPEKRSGKPSYAQEPGRLP